MTTPTVAEAWRGFNAALQDLARASAAVQRALDAAAAEADRRPTPAESLNPDRLLRLTEAAKVLGMSRSTVYRAIRESGLPVVLVGTEQRVRVADLLAWIADQPGTHQGRGRRR